MPEHLLSLLLLQIFFVGYSPGPANIYALAMSIRYGHRRAMVMWLGLVVGFVVAMIAMTVITHFIGVTFGKYVWALKYIGAAYLCYLAYAIWHNSGNGEDDKRSCSFVNGVVMQLTNAKMLLFELTIFSTFVLPYSTSYTHLIECGMWLLLAGPGANLAWIMAGSMLQHFLERYLREVDIISALALVGCAIYIAL